MSAGTLTTGPCVSLLAEPETVLVSPGDVPTAVIVIVPSARPLMSAEAVQALDVQAAAADDAVAEPSVNVTETDTSATLHVPDTL